MGLRWIHPKYKSKQVLYVDTLLSFRKLLADFQWFLRGSFILYSGFSEPKEGSTKWVESYGWEISHTWNIASPFEDDQPVYQEPVFADQIKDLNQQHQQMLMGGLHDVEGEVGPEPRNRSSSEALAGMVTISIFIKDTFLVIVIIRWFNEGNWLTPHRDGKLFSSILSFATLWVMIFARWRPFRNGLASIFFTDSVTSK